MRTLKILIHLSGGANWVGGIQYTRNLLRALSRVPAHECPPICVLVGDRNANAGFEEEFGRLPNITVDRPCPATTWRGRVGEWFGPPRRLVDDCTVAFPLQSPLTTSPGTPIYWIPDFQDKYYPEYFPEAERQSRDRSRQELFRQARFLVFSSQTVKTDFERFFPQLPQLKVRVLPFCTVLDDEEWQANPVQVCERFGLPERFAYVPNQFWQHKGHDTIFAALALLRRQGLKLPIVCTGNPDDYRNADYFQSLQRFLVENDLHDLHDQVTMLGLIPRFEQIQVFRRAALVVQASRFEGWSTVVEDARALGRPMVLSDLAVHKEQAPADAEYFPVGNSEQLAGILSLVWPRCQPGPSLDETSVASAAGHRTIAFARSFLAIAAEAHSVAPPIKPVSLRRRAAFFLHHRTPRLARVLRTLVAPLVKSPKSER